MQRRYYRAVEIANFIIEGHTLAETADEFGLSKCTIQRDLEFLIQNGYGEESNRNIKLYKKAKIQLQKNKKVQVFIAIT